MSSTLSLSLSCLVLVTLVWNWSLSRGHNYVSFGLLDVLVFRTPRKWCFSTLLQLYCLIQPLTSSVFQHLLVWSYPIFSCDLTCLQAFDPYPHNSVSINTLKFLNATLNVWLMSWSFLCVLIVIDFCWVSLSDKSLHDASLEDLGHGTCFCLFSACGCGLEL